MHLGWHTNFERSLLRDTAFELFSMILCHSPSGVGISIICISVLVLLGNRISPEKHPIALMHSTPFSLLPLLKLNYMKCFSRAYFFNLCFFSGFPGFLCCNKQTVGQTYNTQFSNLLLLQIPKLVNGSETSFIITALWYHETKRIKLNTCKNTKFWNFCDNVITFKFHL